MSELLQTGQHPNADQLSAFVEDALPAHEHEWLLAHLAVCPDCRCVVAVSMPPVEELPKVQPMPVRRPWFTGWNLVWPVAAVFAALILIVMLVRKGGGSSPPTQIAETHPLEKQAVVAGVAPAQAGLPASRSASPSPTDKDRSAVAEQAPKSAADKASSEPKVEDRTLADLPFNGRNVQSPPSSAAASPQTITGVAGNGSGLGLAQQTQASGRVVDNLNQQLSVSAGMPAAAPPTAYSMGGPAAAPPAASPASPPLPPSPAVARAGSGSGAMMGGAASASAVDATSDDALAVEPVSNASSAVISGRSLGGLASTGNVVLHPLPSGLAVLSLATAGETTLALDSGNALFLSGDGGAHWKPVRARWQGRAVKVALAVTPVALTQQPVGVNTRAIRGELQGRISTATPTAAAAQPAAGGGATLAGQVTDPAGALIPGAAVTVTNAATSAAVTVETDAAGRYIAGGLAAGAYRIDATARGFASQEMTVTLTASQQGKADLRLQVGQMTETVTVTDAQPQIETESASLSAEVLKSKPKRGAAPVFAIATDAGERWVSADGRSWKRE
jgi:Carboxypeptidase regulatory-like domain/Putative zinc-finger